MRVAPNLYTSINAAIEQSDGALQTAVNQLSSGKDVSVPSDNPLAFATDLQSLAQPAQVDQYTQNADAVITQAQAADSALSSVVTSLTQALSLGTQGANATVNAGQRDAIVQQVQSLLSNVVSQANATSNGVALFGGTATATTPFTLDAGTPNGYTYQGNEGTNQTQVGANTQVTVNMPGDAIFTNANGNVLGSFQQLIAGLQSGSSSDISSATNAISDAIAQIGEVRAVYGGTVDQLNAQNSFLSQETISLSSQQSSLTDVDTATAATNLTQAQTANSAILAVAAKVLPQSLLNYLQN